MENPCGLEQKAGSLIPASLFAIWVPAFAGMSGN